MRFAVLLLVGLLLSCPVGPDRAWAAGDPEAEGSFMVSVDRDRLTVRLKGIPLGMALKAIAQKSGVALTLEAPLEEEVTIAFDDLPVEEGLRRLLGSRSFVFVYAAAELGQPVVLKGVKVLAKGRGGVRANGAREEHLVTPWWQAALEGPDPARRREAVEALADSQEPGQHLAILLAVLKQDGDSDVREAALDALQSLDAIPLEPLFNVALQDREPSIRTKALELLAEKGKSDRQVKAVLLRASKADPDEEVRETASSLLEHFETEEK